MARILYDRLNEIKTKHLSPQSVTGEKIASNSIEEKHLKNGSVTRDKIADKIVGTDEIIDGAVTKPKIAKNSVSSDAIIGGAVTTEKIADAAVTSTRIASGAITTEKIATGAITRDKVADRSVGTDDLVDGAVTTPKLAISSVTKAKLAPNSVGDSELIDGSVTTSKITPQSVNREKLNDDVIAAFGHKFNFVSPWRILGPATYENAVPWTELPLATHLPEGTFAVILQLEISNPPYETGGRPSPEMLSAVHIAMNPAPELRGWVNIRKDESQESGLSVGYQSGTSGTVNFAQGIVPVTEARTIEWELQGDFIPPQTKRVTVAIKLIGYIA